jgi:hypothetical protein
MDPKSNIGAPVYFAQKQTSHGLTRTADYKLKISLFELFLIRVNQCYQW